MTETPLPLPPPQTAIPSQAVVAPIPPISQPDAPRKVETVEEEPYTIKCICNFSDDDGNTIYCETCDTWQHIECFYPDSREEALREDFAHSCAECKPRVLNIQKAIERTKRLSNAPLPHEAPDKKTKRHPSKGQKKKPKPTDLLLNGHTSGQENGKHGSPNEPTQPNKKVKASHRPSHSTSSMPNKRSPSYGNGRTNGHPPSPATTPPDLPNDFEIHGYSDRFRSLYNNENEADVQKAPSNSFSSLAASNSVSLWPRNKDKMVEDTGQRFDEVFQKLPQDMATRQRQLIVKDKQVPTSEGALRWKYLTTPAAIEKDVPLIELYGQIGFQKDYCSNPDNLWEELSSPLPFVFFHPALPLCIDTRNELSPARYVRRSCKPNAILDTYLSAEYEYHFWLVSDRSIAANEQITLPWDFRLPKSQKARMLHLIGLNDDDVPASDEPDMDEPEYNRISGWLYHVLSEYGGCACDLGSNCAFARFHRYYQSRALPRAQAPKKKSRKPKVHTISPTSTGHAANSRAASESHNEDGDQDAPSVSDPSKPPSRERTPGGGRQGSLDQPEILTQLTDRDKRKVQMVEDSFRRMEQQAPPRKKKRASDGTGSVTGTGLGISTPGNKPKSKAGSTTSSSGPRYVDAGTSRSKSGSPTSTHSMNGLKSSLQSRPAASTRSGTDVRPVYCDAAVQTEPVQGEWYSSNVQLPRPRRRVISLSQRLLNNRHRIRCDAEDRRKSQGSLGHVSPSASATETPVQARPGDSSPVSAREGSIQGEVLSPSAAGVADTTMTDAPSLSPTMTKPPTPVTMPESEKARSPDLRVQMPPVPVFGAANTTGSGFTTPQSAVSVLRSPFSAGGMPSPFVPPAVNGVAAHPSPAKKKLSLSDYTKSRANKKTTGLKTPAEETKPPLDIIIDAPNGGDFVDTAVISSTRGLSPVHNDTNTTSL